MSIVRFFLGAFLFFAIGCGGEIPSNLGKRSLVKGSITLKNKPLTKAYVVFTPIEKGKGEEQIAELSKSGDYTLSLFPGKYKVSLQGNKSVPPKFWSPKTSEREVEISAGDIADFKIPF